ncbi:hypothetical protein RHMOL_Rhmol02G0116500 [Rhododendron molle]|uniref:Uncharacterized protein n=1 Tax=Rhododendron molle TaxID=49168 RepID=A0ACC0PS54_RHOML|nr:hypothetical protein RHMOL_Rhmol02G0116500 [Rhododendron molle]
MAIHNFIYRDKNPEDLFRRAYKPSEYVFKDLPDLDPELEDRLDKRDDEVDGEKDPGMDDIRSALHR